MSHPSRNSTQFSPLVLTLGQVRFVTRQLPVSEVSEMASYDDQSRPLTPERLLQWPLQTLSGLQTMTGRTGPRRTEGNTGKRRELPRLRRGLERHREPRGASS